MRLGYFLGLAKSVLVPSQTVPYLGFLSDSARQVFHLKPEKTQSFLALVKDILEKPFVTVKTLQRLMGKCVSFSLVVPAAKLFTSEMNATISRGQQIAANHTKPLPLTGNLRDEIEHWFFLGGWDDSLPWREECHVRLVISYRCFQLRLGWFHSSPIYQQGFRLLDRGPLSLGDLDKGSDSCRQSADVISAAVTKYKSRGANGQQGSRGCLEQPEREKFRAQCCVKGIVFHNCTIEHLSTLVLYSIW